MIYRLKSAPFGGYRVNLEKDKNYIAVDKKKVTPNTTVEWGEEKMFLKGKKVLKELDRADKFKRGTFYTLCYFEWKPDIKQMKFI